MNKNIFFGIKTLEFKVFKERRNDIWYKKSANLSVLARKLPSEIYYPVISVYLPSLAFVMIT